MRQLIRGHMCVISCTPNSKRPKNYNTCIAQSAQSPFPCPLPLSPLFPCRNPHSKSVRTSIHRKRHLIRPRLPPLPLPQPYIFPIPLRRCPFQTLHEHPPTTHGSHLINPSLGSVSLTLRPSVRHVGVPAYDAAVRRCHGEGAVSDGNRQDGPGRRGRGRGDRPEVEALQGKDRRFSPSSRSFLGGTDLGFWSAKHLRYIFIS